MSAGPLHVHVPLDQPCSVWVPPGAGAEGPAAGRTDSPVDVADRLQACVSEGLNGLPLWLRWWVRAHLVTPRPVVLCTNPDTGTHGTFWLVTDHVGLDDAPFRIVFDGVGFGLEMTLEDGVSYLVHQAASFAEAVQCM